MSVLQNQYFNCYKYYRSYKEDYLLKDITQWEVRNQCNFNFTSNDLSDITSELKCLLLADVNKKYQACQPIYHLRSYVMKTCRYDLYDILRRTKKYKIQKLHYEKEWKLKMIDANNRKNGELLVVLDKYSYEEVRELFKAVLTMKEIAVIYLIHCGFSYGKIAKTLKISEDYCRKLYNGAESKLRQALGIGK